MKVEDLARLVREGGEACVPVIRGFLMTQKKSIEQFALQTFRNFILKLIQRFKFYYTGSNK